MTLQVDQRIIAARTQMLVEEPFWGTLAMHLVVKPYSGCTTMATDGVSLYYNPAYPNREGMGMRQLKRSWKHEVLHCSLGHTTRRGNRDPVRWNIACDHVVNLMLKRGGEEIPPNLYCDERFWGFSAEQVYRILEDEERAQEAAPQEEPDDPEQQDQSGDTEDDQNVSSGDGEHDDDSSDDASDESGDEPGEDDADGDEQGDAQGQGGEGEPGEDAESDDGGDGEAGGQPSNGSGSTPAEPGADGPVCHGDPGDCGEVLDAAPAYDEAGKDHVDREWQIYVQQAVNVARKAGEGKLPGFAETLIQHLNEDRTDWRDVLRRFVDPVSATKDYTWSNPSRRMMGLGYFVPGMISDGINHAAFIIDSSGSMDDQLLADKVAPAVQRCLDEGAIDKVTVVVCDTRVTRTGEYMKGDEIDFSVPGRGGTAFRPAFEWLNENCPDIAFAIYFTDGDATDYGPEPSYACLWAMYGNPAELKHHMARVPFGECVDVAQ